MMWGPWGGWGFGMGLLWLLFVTLLVVGVVLVVRGSAGGASRPADRTALDILDERFARGEIDRDEYEERRRVLQGARG